MAFVVQVFTWVVTASSAVMSCLTRAASMKRLAGDGEDVESGVE